MASANPATTLLTAADSEGRASAAALAAAVDRSSPLGARVGELLEDLANGQDILVLRSDRNVTPAGAAEILGVSRQFVDRLLADGVLEFHRLPDSNHRRIRVADVLALAEDRDRIRRGRETLSKLLS